MLGKTLASAAFACVLIVAPAAGAFAGPTYPASDKSLACSSANVVNGGTFTCTVGGAEGSKATLGVTTSGADAAIRGTVSLTKTIDATHVATFTVTAPSTAGAIAISAAIDGVAADSTTVVASASGLAATGADKSGLGIAAGGFALMGVGTILMVRRRRALRNW
ncbi:LPXTG cell wall anchor domain-containing protein [Demequina lutea]|uniref:LPXTG-motif cell wall-anchored protein n=1 Tax=Demequina lutea TaxID=431489 RepID=A0A7Y9ZAA0_9MICO|nr:LPXTG cell wall anchor domain-containing protein [Demequina lutea]NYI40390.1 LPXTG-motif cell wall-anchored protein [Demequina lutea]